MGVFSLRKVRDFPTSWWNTTRIARSFSKYSVGTICVALTLVFGMCIPQRATATQNYDLYIIGGGNGGNGWGEAGTATKYIYGKGDGSDELITLNSLKGGDGGTTVYDERSADSGGGGGGAGSIVLLRNTDGNPLTEANFPADLTPSKVSGEKGEDHEMGGKGGQGGTSYGPGTSAGDAGGERTPFPGVPGSTIPGRGGTGGSASVTYSSQVSPSLNDNFLANVFISSNGGNAEFTANGLSNVLSAVTIFSQKGTASLKYDGTAQDLRVNTVVMESSGGDTSFTAAGLRLNGKAKLTKNAENLLFDVGTLNVTEDTTFTLKDTNAINSEHTDGVYLGDVTVEESRKLILNGDGGATCSIGQLTMKGVSTLAITDTAIVLTTINLNTNTGTRTIALTKNTGNLLFDVGTLNVTADTTFTLKDTNAINPEHTSGVYLGDVTVNPGISLTIAKTGTASAAYTLGAATVEDGGTLSISTGVTSYFNGDITVSSETLATSFTAGPLTLSNTDSAISLTKGAGALTFDLTSLVIDAPGAILQLKNTASENVNLGNLTVNPNKSLTIQPADATDTAACTLGAVTLDGGTLNINSGVTPTFTSLTLNSTTRDTTTFSFNGNATIPSIDVASGAGNTSFSVNSLTLTDNDKISRITKGSGDLNFSINALVVDAPGAILKLRNTTNENVYLGDVTVNPGKSLTINNAGGPSFVACSFGKITMNSGKISGDNIKLCLLSPYLDTMGDSASLISANEIEVQNAGDLFWKLQFDVNGGSDKIEVKTINAQSVIITGFKVNGNPQRNSTDVQILNITDGKYPEIKISDNTLDEESATYRLLVSPGRPGYVTLNLISRDGFVGRRQVFHSAALQTAFELGDSVLDSLPIDRTGKSPLAAKFRLWAKSGSLSHDQDVDGSDQKIHIRENFTVLGIDAKPIHMGGKAICVPTFFFGVNDASMTYNDDGKKTCSAGGIKLTRLHQSFSNLSVIGSFGVIKTDNANSSMKSNTYSVEARYGTEGMPLGKYLALAPWIQLDYSHVTFDDTVVKGAEIQQKGLNVLRATVGAGLQLDTKNWRASVGAKLRKKLGGQMSGMVNGRSLDNSTKIDATTMELNANIGGKIAGTFSIDLSLGKSCLGKSGFLMGLTMAAFM